MALSVAGLIASRPASSRNVRPADRRVRLIASGRGSGSVTLSVQSVQEC
jgi:hypothetical protein